MPTAGAARAWDRENDFEVWPQVPTQTSEPPRNEELQTEIEKAKKILELTNDWDGQGAESYASDTFDRAITFLAAHSDFLKQFGLALPVPHIGAGPNGSIDLHWKSASWELLVNVPADMTKMASFYGDNYGVQKIKGSVDPKTCNPGLAAWLMN